MRGRKPQPTEVLKLVGSEKASRRKKEPKPSGSPTCPTWLSAEAKAEWKRVVASMPAEVFKVTDRAVLAAFCQAWSDYHEAVAEMRQIPKVYETEKGYQGQSPWVNIASKSADQMRKLAVELGLTPSARVRLNGISDAKPAKEVDFDAFVSNRA